MTKEDKENNKPTNIHDLFPEFSLKDREIGRIELFFGVFFLMIVRLSFDFLFAYIIQYKINKRMREIGGYKNLKKEDKEYITSILKYWVGLVLKVAGVKINFRKYNEEDVNRVYRKYLGPNYNPSFSAPFGILISNHSSLIEVFVAQVVEAPGFISRENVRSIPFVGPVAAATNSVFVSRDSASSREDTLNALNERENEHFKDRDRSIPLMIFPEGTTTTCKHILNFKKGAFVSLSPVKPYIIQPSGNSDFQFACGACSAAVNFGRALTRLSVSIDYFSLPVIEATEFMYKTYSSPNKEKWEVFAGVTRAIMSELSGLKQSEASLRDSWRYLRCCKDEKFYTKEEYQEMMNKNGGRFI